MSWRLIEKLRQTLENPIPGLAKAPFLFPLALLSPSDSLLLASRRELCHLLWKRNSTIFSARTPLSFPAVNPLMTLVSVWLSPPPSWSKSARLTEPNKLLQQSVSWQFHRLPLTSSCSPVARLQSTPQTSSHLASEKWGRYSFTSFQSRPKLSDMPAFPRSTRSSLWNPDGTVQAWNSARPAPEPRHWHEGAPELLLLSLDVEIGTFLRGRNGTTVTVLYSQEEVLHYFMVVASVAVRQEAGCKHDDGVHSIAIVALIKKEKKKENLSLTYYGNSLHCGVHLFPCFFCSPVRRHHSISCRSFSTLSGRV